MHMPRIKEQLPQLAEDFEKGMNIRKLRDRYHLGNKSLLKRLVEARRRDMISDRALSRLLIDRTQHDFPNDPEARLEAVLSCINSELKQATLLMLDRNPRTCYEIRSRLTKATSAALPMNATFLGYCKYTLSPIGFLVQELFGKGLGFANSYFSISAAGERYGHPIAAFSVKYAVDNNISLYQLFGPTNSPGDSRAPYNAARIIELVAEGHDQIAKLVDELGLDTAGVSLHLRRLQSLGILTFKTGEKHIYDCTDSRLPEKAKTVRTYKKLTEDVANWLYEHKAGDYKQIASELRYKDPKKVSLVLAGLAYQGLCRQRFSHHQRSEIRTGERLALVRNYITPVRSKLADEPGEIDAVHEEFRRDGALFKQYLDAAIELYRAISPRINFMAGEEREAELIEFIKAYQAAHGIGPRPVDVGEQLGWNIGNVNIHLRSLYERGVVSKKREGRSVRYGIGE